MQGEGLAAVGAAFAVIGAFREAAHREPTLTALIIGVDSGTEAQAINCGHIPPHLLHDGTVITPLLGSGVPLGLAELAAEPATVDWFAFPTGSTLLLTTDGLTETRATDGTFYPVDERLTKHLDLSPTELPQALHEDARAFAGDDRRHDDIAVLAVRRPPRRAGTPIRLPASCAWPDRGAHVRSGRALRAHAHALIGRAARDEAFPELPAGTRARTGR